MSQQTIESRPETLTTGAVIPPVRPHPVTVEVRVRLQALAILEPDGRYSVVVPALPGCVTQGETIEEVQEMVVDAAEGWLDVAHDQMKDEATRVALGE